MSPETLSRPSSGLPTNAAFPGLTPPEVKASRAAHGVNLLSPPVRTPWWREWLGKFADPIIRILIIAAVLQIGIGAYQGEYLEGVAIVAAILLATTLAFVNEYRAAREFDVLNRVDDDTPVKAIRAGEFVTVPKRDLVVGDVILVEPGEELPADGEVLSAMGFNVAEANLTGEARPVRKVPAYDLGGDGAGDHAYPPNLVYRGTTVADGSGVVRVTRVGDGTELGKLGAKAAEVAGGQTPLNHQLERLSKWIGIVGFSIASATFLALVLRGHLVGELVLTPGQWLVVGTVVLGVAVMLSRVWLKMVLEGLEAFGLPVRVPEYYQEETVGRWLAAVFAGLVVVAVGLEIESLAGSLPAGVENWIPPEAADQLIDYFLIAVVIIVVAVPEGLAMSVTLSLAYSMRKMTAQNTLVRKMHACETIGAATVICSDKTGTLTQNLMQVVEARFGGVTGESLTDAPADSAPARLVEAFAVNTTAHLTRETGVATALGNPTEGALLIWLAGQGVDYLAERARFQVESQLPFTTERKVMATRGRGRGGEPVTHLKGAPEVVLARCARQQSAGGDRGLTDADRGAIQQSLANLQARGMRTLGFACRPGADAGVELADDLNDLVWLGHVGIADPVRPDVPAAIASCRRAGLEVKIVTGDTPITAREIGRQIGLFGATAVPGEELTGPEFAALSDPEAARAAKSLKILARARPLDKLRLVRLLQDQNEVVAVTGDGTNDAPALNHAKVGLAMGRSGTAVAKEAADVVILDDSFASIVTAVRWGRGLYENIQRFIVFQLTINFVALGVALVGPFLGVKLPLTVLQMLWVNLIMDTFAALALATEPPNESVLNRKPRHPESFIITRAMARRILTVGAVFLATLWTLLSVMPRADATRPEELLADHDHAWWLSVFFSVFVLLQFWNLFNARVFGTDRPALAGLGRNPAFLVIAAAILLGQVLLVQYGGAVFRTVPLSLETWAAIIVGTSPVLLLGELARLVRRQQ